MARHRIDLGWMRLFAETVRQGSLSAAAASLGLTQPAVSYQIRRIEEQAGFPLLRRNRHGVELTAKGRKLYDIVERAVDEVDTLLREETAGRSVIRLHTDTAFSSLWLIPRLDAFRNLHPDIDIQFIISQRFNPHEREDRDIGVVFGAMDDFGPHASILVPEVVVPVCTQAYLDANGGFADPADLASARLIHIDTASPAPWFNWDQYLAGLGLKRGTSSHKGDLSVNAYSLVVQAAIGNQGVALGWRGVIDDLLRSKILVPAGPTLQAPHRGYWLLPPRVADANASRLMAWLKEETQRGRAA